ncbi:MAG: PadR family transcriptional regulator [Anaerolineales bacterium]|nr:PadR family transcriptional regulator [Anaerolineales bacterium]
MSLKHAILGFLSYKSLNGYDLKKAFDNSVRHFWPANQSQIYRTLAQMTDEGLIEKEVIEREERLDMKIYSITKAGRTELHNWLATPLPERDVREPLLIQIFFGGKLSDEELLNLLQHEKKIAEEGLLAYQAIHQATISQPAPPDPRAFYLSMLTLEYGLKSNYALIEWLNSAIEHIETKNYSL